MKKTLVAYISIVGIRSEDINDYMHKIVNNIMPEDFEGTLIYMPTNSLDSRIECIDPKYITNKDLILDNEELLAELNKKLKTQLKEYEKD